MAANVGNQIVTVKFYDPADSPVVNKRQKGITPVGIFSGGYLTRVNDTLAQLSILVCEIQDNVGDNDQVRIETQSTVNVVVGAATPYVVLRWEYTASASADYMELLGVASPDTYDLVVGKCSYSGATLTGFVYAERTNPNILDFFLKVEAEATPSLSVRVRAGYVQIGSSSVQLPDKDYGPFVPPLSGSKTGAVYIDDAGAIQISSDYTYTGKVVLAEIALTASQTTIVVDNITDVRSFLTQPAVPDGVTIEKSGSGKLQVKALGIQNTHINSNVPDGTTIEKSGSTGELQVKALGIQNTHINNNVPDGVTIEKSGSTGKLQMKKYDSGWFAITNNTLYTKAHNLGAAPSVVLGYIAENSDGSGNRAGMNDSNTFGVDGSGNQDYHNRGTGICTVDVTNVKIRTGLQSICLVNTSTGVVWNPTSGFARIIAFL